MNISEIHVGDQLRGHVKEDMEKEFVGEVEKITKTRFYYKLPRVMKLIKVT